LPLFNVSGQCKQVEQATTDADGKLGLSAALQVGVPTRTTSYTYNARGQVLTEKDASGATTTHTYYTDSLAEHMVGDKQSTTNNLGQVTTYTRYNPHGQVLSMTDANGQVSTYTYDARQRLTASSRGGRTTLATYDAAGQLTRITLPNASLATSTWVGFEYDAAHRQTAVFDSRGNRITYTLNALGERIAQTVQGASGTLKRNLAASLDALSRVQQSTLAP
jgi:YD repeat-containing protein